VYFVCLCLGEGSVYWGGELDNNIPNLMRNGNIKRFNMQSKIYIYCEYPVYFFHFLDINNHSVNMKYGK